MGIEYDKKKLTILRAVLIIIGGTVGGTAIWQYFAYFPHLMRLEFRIVIIAVSAVVLAAILGLSAKPFYRLGRSIAELFLSMLRAIGGRGMVGGFLGLIAAGAFVFLFDVLIRSSQDIWAVRLLMDILVYIASAAALCYMFIKYLTAERDEQEDVYVVRKRGFLLSAECLSDERALTVARSLINVKVCDGAYKALLLHSDGDREAAARLESMVKDGTVELIRTRKDFASSEDYAALERHVAASKRLRLICPAAKEADDIALSVFAAAGEAI